MSHGDFFLECGLNRFSYDALWLIVFRARWLCTVLLRSLFLQWTISDAVARASYSSAILDATATTGDVTRFRDFSWPLMISANPDEISYIFAGFNDGVYLQYRSGATAATIVENANVSGFTSYPNETFNY